MINFKREYIGLEQDRLLYPVSFKDKAKCNVYGRKKFITEAGEEQLSAHVFLISKDFWTFNAGQLDFTNYPNGIWNDYISIDIIEKDEYTAPSINFGSMGDITPENLQGLSDYISKHLSDLEKRIVEDYLFIDEGVSENIELPNLPENHFWVRRNGVIVGVNLDYLKTDYEHFKNELWKNYESFNEKLQAALKKYYDDLELQMNNFFKDLIEKIREEAEKQLGLIAGAGGGLLHKIDQANHGFIFDPIVYENGVWKKATTTSGVDGIGVVISANTFFFLEAGEIEIPKGATDKDGQPLLDDEYYYMNEDGGTGFQKEEPVWFYQPLFHTRIYKGKLLANVHIDTMEDLRGQVVDTESGRTHGIALWGDIVPKFDTIEKLQKAFWLKEGEVVEVLGYYSPGDGANHKRIIKAEDDGSGVQLNNGLWACIVHNGEVNVKCLGVTATDNYDKEYMNKQSDLINKVFSGNNNIEVILFPKGWYNFGKPLVWEVNKNITLKGISDKIKEVNLRSYCQHGEYLLTTHSQSTEENQNWGGITIKGIRFLGVRSQLNSGIKIHHAPWVKFDNVLIEGFGGNGIEIGEVEDSEFNKLSIFQCGRSSLGVEQDGDDTNSTHWAIFLNNDLSSDANNMIRFIDCRIERNRSYPYIMSNGKGALWVNFYGLHSEIGDKQEVWGQENITFMNATAGITTFTDCHIDNFGYVFSMNYGDLYAENCRYMSIKSIENNTKKTVRISNCSSNKCILGTGDIKFYANNVAFGELNFSTSGNSIFLISGCDINKIHLNRAYSINHVTTITGCSIKEAVFDTDSANIYITGGYINKLTDGSNNSRIDCFVKEIVSSSYNNENTLTRNTSQQSYNLLNHVNNKIPLYMGDLKVKNVKGGVIWNNDFSNNSFAGWVYDPINNKLLPFGKLETTLNAKLVSLNTPYHVEKMKQNGVYNDFITYMDEKTAYDKQQRKLEQDRQLAYEEALKENPELTFEEFMSVQPMTLNLVEEPQPSEALKKFMDKYL